MSRWIDADRLARKLNDAIWVGEKVDMPTGELEAVLNDVLSAPSIDIVRCKECKWWVVAMDENNSDEDYLKCPMDKWPNAEDFCSYGERREP